MIHVTVNFSVWMSIVASSNHIRFLFLLILLHYLILCESALNYFKLCLSWTLQCFLSFPIFFLVFSSIYLYAWYSHYRHQMICMWRIKGSRLYYFIAVAFLNCLIKSGESLSENLSWEYFELSFQLHNGWSIFHLPALMYAIFKES